MKPRIETNWLDRAALAVSPKWGAGRIQNKMRIAAFTESGYLVPGSRKKSMKGITASAMSPDADINLKLTGMRAMSRDLFMNAPLATSILRRHKANVINSGLQLQARVDRDALGITDEAAEAWEAAAEREFDLWSESVFCDYDERMTFGELQGLIFLNMMLSGDVFFFLPFEAASDPLFPYWTKVKVIDADLVRNPANTGGLDIQGGVEKNDRGRTVAIHVWNTYENEYSSTVTAASTRIPMFDSRGRQQVFQVADFERIGQRRGVPLLAPAVEPLKQLTRLSEAQLMSALVSSFFTVFVKDVSGMGATFGPAFTPEETITGGGRYGPTAAPVEAVNQADANDLEMGHGNVTYLDKDTDITQADPRKVDTGFSAFWDALGNQVAAVGGASFEQAMILYKSSYTAARAAMLDVWKGVMNYRTLMSRRCCSICYSAVIEEAVMRGRLSAPRYYDDAIYRKAWSGAYWVGVGMGSINPLDEAKATVFNLSSFTTTREDEYMSAKGGRWDAAMQKRSREEKLLKREGLTSDAAAVASAATEGTQVEAPTPGVTP